MLGDLEFNLHHVYMYACMYDLRMHVCVDLKNIFLNALIILVFNNEWLGNCQDNFKNLNILIKTLKRLAVLFFCLF